MSWRTGARRRWTEAGGRGNTDAMTVSDGPFLYLEDDRDGGVVRSFANPVEIVRADAVGDVASALERVRRAAARGLHAAGFLAYEAGYAFEPRLLGLAENRTDDLPLLWFGLFEAVETIARADLAARLPDPAAAHAASPKPAVSRATYEAGVREIAELIAAGEVYQANLSFRAAVSFAGHPLALWAGLRARAAAGWGGIVHTGDHWLLSASPELFFCLADGRLTARPMKGTARRGVDADADADAVASLAADPKARAENLMIVDLMRNDLSRVSTPGSVVVDRLFAVETYPTVHQMTSTVAATLTPGLGPVDVLAAAFPCGSITGAPKIRAMEAIAAIETEPRGAYTGSMGWIAPGGNAAFNVAIRTLTMSAADAQAGCGKAVLGLGAGIVADSVPADEWAECRDKGAFVTAGQRRFDLMETMRFEPAEGVVDLERHLARLCASAAALGFAVDAHHLRNALQAATFRLSDARGVRLRLSRNGAAAIEVRPLPPRPQGIVDVAVRPLPVAEHDFRLRHKTSDRAFWKAARSAGGGFETIFVDGRGLLTEGSFTSIFVGDPAAGQPDAGHSDAGKPQVETAAMLLTPRRTNALPGVLRGRLIAKGRAQEADLRPSDLGGGFWIGNALRGLIPARLRIVAGQGPFTVAAP